MSKRLQVIFDDAEFAELQEAARARGTTVSAWVRQTLRQARREESTGDIEARLAVVRAAAQHAFPTGDIEQLLSEIEQGYLES